MFKKREKVLLKDVYLISEFYKLKIDKSTARLAVTKLNSLIISISCFDKLKGVLKSTPALSHVNELENVFRADEVENSLTQAEATSTAERKSKGFIKILPVFE